MSSALNDIKITGVVGFSHTTYRKKFIGRNANKGVHGAQATEPVIRIFTDHEPTSAFEQLDQTFLG